MSEVINAPVCISGVEYASMIQSAANALQNQKELINQLNVYPVPDGDTGSNMSMTMQPASTLAAGPDLTVSACADQVAGMFLRAARGNSGVILSLFFRGLAKGLKGLQQADASSLLTAFDSGVKEAYKAVQYPREGTILTVMRSCAEVDGTGCDLLALLDRMYTSAAETLERTPEMLPVLKQAGVVDSGGRGFLEILDGMRLALRGKPVQALAPTESNSKADFASFDTETILNPYCTECIVTKSEAFQAEGSAEKFRRFILAAGDSAVFAEDGEIIKVHVHTKDPGRVLSEALKYGSLYTVKVENMKNQHSELLKKEAQEKTVASPDQPYGFVAVIMGDGMRAVFEDLGVTSFVSGGQTMNPSTEQLVEAVEQTPAKVVYLFPNNANVCMVAEQVAKLVQDRTVLVIPAVSAPQGIAALMQFDPEASAEQNEQVMREALHSVKTLDMTYAAHDSTVNGEKITCGQILGLVNHKVRYVTNDRQACLEKLLTELQDASFVTVFYGSDVSKEEADVTLAYLQQQLPDAEVTVLSGGQPLYYYIISAE